MNKSLTWYECSAQLNAGDRVRFVVPFDIFPHCTVPADTLATVIENNLNEMHCALYVLPDSRHVRHHLSEWDGEVILGAELDAGAEDAATDPDWQVLSPLARVEYGEETAGDMPDFPSEDEYDTDCGHRDDGRGRCIDCGAFLPSSEGRYWR